ncbi:MAG: hypothetical protein ACI9CV_001155, partial [Ilumatobacter sp.]
MLQQSIAGCMQGCTGRDNVVDHKDRHTGNIRTRREFGRIESLSSAETGLGHRSSAPIEQSATGQAELACNGACDLFTLVEPAVAAPLGIRRGPGDRLQIGTAAAFDQTIDQQASEMPSNLTPIAVL